jgi:CRP/FNR family transcriptional regulator, cyclic AMP receptor protein
VPILILHGTLLPLNIWRLLEIRALTRQVRGAARGELPLEGLLPFMTPRRHEAGAILFQRDDLAHEMFYLISGAVRLEELGKTLGVGSVLGEISLFAPSCTRTATAVCESDVELLAITADKVMQLYYQNPTFGFHMVRLITARLIENSAALPVERVPDRAALRPTIDMQAAGATTRELARRVSRHRLRYRLGWGIGLAGLLAFAGWQAAPYLRSLVVRDAAVTSRINVATSPIRGSVDEKLPLPGQRTGADGHIATVRNRHIDDGPAQRSTAGLLRAEATVSDLTTLWPT